MRPSCDSSRIIYTMKIQAEGWRGKKDDEGGRGVTASHQATLGVNTPTIGLSYLERDIKVSSEVGRGAEVGAIAAHPTSRT